MKGSSLIEWLRWNALQPKWHEKIQRKTSQSIALFFRPLRSHLIKFTTSQELHQILQFLEVAGKLKKNIRNSPGNRTWKLWCLQSLKMNIHHLELQINKNAQWQMKSPYFSWHMRWKSHRFFWPVQCFIWLPFRKKHTKKIHQSFSTGRLGISSKIRGSKRL